MRALPLLLTGIAALLSPTLRQEPKLVAASVKFILPKGDNKDHDTRVDVGISNGGTAIAKTDDIAHNIEFDDPGTYGPYDLAVQTAVTKDQFRSSTTNLHISTNGHDRWITNVHIEARFTDNTTLSSESGTIIVDQDNRDAHFVNK